MDENVTIVVCIPDNLATKGTPIDGSLAGEFSQGSFSPSIQRAPPIFIFVQVTGGVSLDASLVDIRWSIEVCGSTRCGSPGINKVRVWISKECNISILRGEIFWPKAEVIVVVDASFCNGRDTVEKFDASNTSRANAVCLWIHNNLLANLPAQN
jgi:hypothetical protein